MSVTCEAITPGDPLKSNDAFQINRAVCDFGDFHATGKGKRAAGRFLNTEITIPFASNRKETKLVPCDTPEGDSPLDVNRTNSYKNFA